MAPAARAIDGFGIIFLPPFSCRHFPANCPLPTEDCQLKTAN